MIAFTDVQYRETDATAACVVVDRFDAERPTAEWTARLSPIAPYEPGAFYKRELPCLLEVLRRAPPLTHVVIDGYVFLDANRTPGLGARLYDALGGKTAVLGLAKTSYQGSLMSTAIARPGSTKPLYLTSIGIDDAEAVALVSQLHGAHRLPTLVKRVDSLARGR
jgi:deoxyribonuclease V